MRRKLSVTRLIISSVYSEYEEYSLVNFSHERL